MKYMEIHMWKLFSALFLVTSVQAFTLEDSQKAVEDQKEGKESSVERKGPDGQPLVGHGAPAPEEHKTDKGCSASH
jgi:hypothetical protein